MNTEKQPKKGEGRLPDRPDPKDVVYSELNLERWPALWVTRDSTKPRTLRRRLTYPDGSTLDATLRISPHPETGDLTTETNKLFSVIMKFRQEHLEGKDQSSRKVVIPFTLGKAGKYLNPGLSKRQRSGGRNKTLIKKHLRKLTRTPIEFQGSFWDAKAEKLRKFEGEFSILGSFFLVEERKFRKAQGSQLPLELGYVRLNDFIEDNLAERFYAPFYLSERLRIQAPFALLLYNLLNLRMAGVAYYERSLKALFEEDFPEKAKEYPTPSKRLRFLRRNIKELAGRKITSGVLSDLQVVSTKKAGDYKLTVRKEPFPLRLVTQTPRQQNDRTPEERNADLSDEELEAELLVEDLLEITRDYDSRAFYSKCVSVYPGEVLRRLGAEIKAGEDPNFQGSRGKLFTVKLKQWCDDHGKEPFWKSDSP